MDFIDRAFASSSSISKYEEKKNLRALRNLLSHKSEAIRLGAAEALIRLYMESYDIEQLKYFLNYNNKNIQYQAAKGLLVLGNQDGVAFFISVIKQRGGHYSDYFAREEVSLLANAGSIAFSSLIELLLNTYSWVRAAAIDALGIMKDPRAIGPIISYARNSEDFEYSSVKNALLNLGEECLPALINILKNDGIQIRKNSYGYFEDYNHQLRNLTVELIGEFKFQAGLQILINCLDDPYVDGHEYSTQGSFARRPVAVCAGTALGNIGNDKAVEALIEHFDNECSRMREQVVIALAKIGNARAMDLYLKGITDIDNGVRRESVAALEKLSLTSTVNMKIDTIRSIADLYSSSVEACAKAAEALAKGKDKTCLEHLGRVLIKWRYSLDHGYDEDGDGYIRLTKGIAAIEQAINKINASEKPSPV